MNACACVCVCVFCVCVGVWVCVYKIQCMEIDCHNMYEDNFTRNIYLDILGKKIRLLSVKISL